MTTTISRTKSLNIFGITDKLGPYDEMPVLPAGVDPQPVLSRNDRPQPFFLICAKDVVVAQMSGSGDIEFRYSNVLRHHLEPADVVYVPAGTPHRFVPTEESLQLRYKAQRPGMEAVCWFCSSCDAELWRHEFDADAIPPQQGYLDGCGLFNANQARRTCGTCSTVHPPVDLEGFRWEQIADELAKEQTA